MRQRIYIKDKRIYVKRLNPTKVPYGIMIIGINPSSSSSLTSAWDDKFGSNLLKFLEGTGIEKDEIWLTNLYKFPTEKNRRLLPSEVEEGWEELKEEMEEANPKAIIAMGEQVIRCFGGKAYEKGVRIQNERYVPVYCIPHIAYFGWAKDESARRKAKNLIKQIKK